MCLLAPFSLLQCSLPPLKRVHHISHEDQSNCVGEKSLPLKAGLGDGLLLMVLTPSSWSCANQATQTQSPHCTRHRRPSSRLPPSGLQQLGVQRAPGSSGHRGSTSMLPWAARPCRSFQAIRAGKDVTVPRGDSGQGASVPAISNLHPKAPHALQLALSSHALAWAAALL